MRVRCERSRQTIDWSMNRRCLPLQIADWQPGKRVLGASPLRLCHPLCGSGMNTPSKECVRVLCTLPNLLQYTEHGDDRRHAPLYWICNGIPKCSSDLSTSKRFTPHLRRVPSHGIRSCVECWPTSDSVAAILYGTTLMAARTFC